MANNKLAEGYTKDLLSNMTLEQFKSLPYEEQKKLYNWYGTDTNYFWTGNDAMNPKNLRKVMSKPLKEIVYGARLPEVTVTAPSLTKAEPAKLAIETDWTPEEVREMQTPDKKIIHFNPLAAKEHERKAQKFANGVAAIMAPAFLPAAAPLVEMAAEAGAGEALSLAGKAAWNGAKTVGSAALRGAYNVVPKIGQALDMSFPGTLAWWLLYNGSKFGKLLASGFAAGEALGTSTAVNNFMENPSAENATYAGLSMIPWAAGTTNGIRSYNTARNYSKAAKALETKHDIDLDASYAGDVLRKHGIGPKDYIHINGREGYDPMTGEYRMMTGSYEKDGQLVPLGGYEVDRQGNKQTAIWFKQGSSEYNPRSGDVYVLPYANSADIPLHQEDWGNVFVSRNPIDMQKIRKFRWDYDKHDLVEIPTEYTSKLTEAEKLGIPRGERNLWLKGRTADMAQDVGIGLKNPKYQQRVRDLHFLAKAPETKVVNADGSPAHLYHGTPNKGWTVYDKNKFGSATDSGMYGEGLYTTSHKNYANIYAINNSPTGEIVGEVKDFYVNGKNPFYIYWNGMSPSEKVIRNEAALLFNRTIPVKGNIPENVWQELNSADVVIEEFGKRRPNFSEVVIPKSELVKLADAVTYDNSGKVIPISKRDNFTNPDIRFKSGGKLNYLKFYK